MKLRSTVISLLASSCLAFMAGCGGGTSGQAQIVPGSKLDEAQTCIACHPTPTSPGTGENIVQEWKASVHNTRDGAGCRDCHEPNNHPSNSCNSCHNGAAASGVDEIQRNPDKQGKCLKCHNNKIGYHGELNPQLHAGILVDAQLAHFNNTTTAGNTTYSPSYVTYEYTDKATGKANACRKCHNPHDPTSAINYSKDFARSSHGMVERLPQPTLVPTDGATVNYDGSLSYGSSRSIYDARIAPREEMDAKTRGTFEPASQVQTDSTVSNRSCVRCHTTTGYINFVNSGFTDLSPFGPTNPATGKPYTYYPSNEKAPPTSGKEVTGCNACHDNGAGVAYDFRKLRKVPAAVVYYNYSSKSGVSMTGGKITTFKYTYPDAGDSNMCIVCHSGRLIGLNIKMASAKGLDFSKAGRTLLSHYRASAQMVFQSGGFEYYSSSSKYYGAGDPDYHYSHVDIGMNRLPRLQTWLASKGIIRNIGVNAGDKRSHGPCIGCHMNSAGKETSSHTFLPVNREAGATYRPGYPFQNDPSRQPDAIGKVVSNACSACHRNGSGWDPTDLQYEKTKYAAAALAVREVLLYALHTQDAKRTFDTEGRPAAPTNWYDSGSGDRMQVWLRSTAGQTVAGSEFVYPVGAPGFTGNKYAVQKAAYNLGAYYNFWMMYSDPGGFAHNAVYAKRLMYDTIDWLDDGVLNQSVKETFLSGLPKVGLVGAGSQLNLKTRMGTTAWQDAYNYLLTNDGVDNPGRPVP